MSKRKLPLWCLLLERGFFEERKEAASWVMSNKVLINGRPAVFEGEQVREDVEIAIKGYEQKYVGKGGLKLEGALECFQIDVSGKIALDTGASTVDLPIVYCSTAWRKCMRSTPGMVIWRVS